MARDSVAHRESTGQRGCPDALAGRVVDAETRARMDAISAAASESNRVSNERLDAFFSAADTDVTEAETSPSADIPIDAAISAAGRSFAEKFDEAVDRVIARVRAAAALAAAAARLRHQATAALGIIVIAALRSTAHGGRASQARADGDADAAADHNMMPRFAGVSTWNRKPGITQMPGSFASQPKVAPSRA